MTTKNRNTSHPYVPRVNTGGNYCGHDPKAPKLSLKTPFVKPTDPAHLEQKNRNWAYDESNPKPKSTLKVLPLILCDLLERLEQYYRRPNYFLPSLNQANETRKIKRNPELAETIKHRQQRSERREACIVVIGAILKYTDLVSLRVGIPTAKGFVNLTLSTLCKQTNLGLKRFTRAIDDLKHADIITLSQPRQLLEDGRWIGLAAVKALSWKLFEAFNLGTKLRREREKASKRLKQKSDGWAREKNKNTVSRAGQARMSLFVNSRLKDDKKKSPTPRYQQSDTDRRKLLMNLAVKFRLENPDWSIEQCHQAAENEVQKTA